MIGRSARLSLVAVAALMALGVGASGAAAATFVVSSVEDLPNSNPACTSPCSLRQAIVDANRSHENSTVEVPPGTYRLTQGALEVDPIAETSETILGLAKRANEVAITATGRNQVMSVGLPTGGVGETVVELVEITGGNFQGAGGGIRVNAGATLTLDDAAVEGNTSEEPGGGIDTGGALNLTSSLIADNHAQGARGFGGGIYVVPGGSAKVLNSTIAENTASGEEGGAAIDNQAKLTLLSTTIAGNENEALKGGALAGHSTELLDSILAENKPQDCSAKVSDPQGHNIADDASCSLTGPGDKPETKAQLAEEAGRPRLADNEGPTETIALQATSPAIAAGEFCPATDQRNVARPAKLCDIGAYQFSKEMPSSPPGKGAQTTSGPSPSNVGNQPPAPPVLARTGDVAPVSGTVLIRLPGARTFVALSSLRSVPFGTVINATNGRVVVTTAGPHGGIQTGEFFLGEFVLSQSRNGVVRAALTGGNFSVCPTARERSHFARASASHASGKHVVRKLWANAHGSYSTKGNYATGAVEGTEWLTEDLCDGTLIRVTRDKVLVTNLVNHRHFTIKAGHSYLAKVP